MACLVSHRQCRKTQLERERRSHQMTQNMDHRFIYACMHWWPEANTQTKGIRRSVTTQLVHVSRSVARSSTRRSPTVQVVSEYTCIRVIARDSLRWQLVHQHQEMPRQCSVPTSDKDDYHVPDECAFTAYHDLYRGPQRLQSVAEDSRYDRRVEIGLIFMSAIILPWDLLWLATIALNDNNYAHLKSDSCCERWPSTRLCCIGIPTAAVIRTMLS